MIKKKCKPGRKADVGEGEVPIQVREKHFCGKKTELRNDICKIET